MQPLEAKSARWRRWTVRLAMLVGSTFIGLWLADKIVGAVCHTAERHLLRMPAHLSYRHRSTEFDYLFRLNSRGLRGPEIPIASAANTFRIAVLGDSFVAGFGVADEDVLTVRLAGLLNHPETARNEDDRAPEHRESQPFALRRETSGQGPATTRFQVINLGRIGTSTVRELNIYEASGRPYHPDVVVLMYCLGNDLREVVMEEDREELARWHPQGAARRIAYGCLPNLYLELAIWKQNRETVERLGPRSEDEILAALDRQTRLHGGDPTEARERYLRLPAEVRGALQQGRLNDWQILPPCFDPERTKRALFPDNDFFARAWARNRRFLDLLHQAVAADGARFVLVAIPDYIQIQEESYRFVEMLGYHVEPEWRTAESPVQKALACWAKDASVPYLDLTDEFRRSPVPLYYREDIHFNPAGHAKAAEVLAQFLADQGLLPPTTKKP